tara:strand:+ start:15866 stop:16591 length:726 start_codon:yes stop_codon:yes gene_type:complete
MDKNESTYVLRWAKKIKAINFLGGKCEHCGEDDIFKLCFHHKDRNEKDFEFNDMKTYRWSLLKKEISKCQLLCNNCHVVLHDNLDGKPKNKENINKLTFLKFKNIFECQKCGYNKNNKALAFHHNHNKKFGLGDNHVVKRKYNTVYDLTNDIKNELKKCDILCFNCHRLEHINIKKFNEYKKEIYKKVANYKEKREPLDKNEIYKMYISGMKQYEIVNELKCAKSTISTILKDWKNNAGVV